MQVEVALASLGALAPLDYAERWDNVGVLLEGVGEVERALLTIDLTEPVLDEALAAGCGLIVAYHPPIFSGFKRLCMGDPQQRILLRAVRAGLTIYSPHTALDAALGGINDWLVEGLGAVTECAPITPHVEVEGVGAGRVATLAQPTAVRALVERLKGHLGLQHLRLASPDPEALVERVAVCPGAGGGLFEGCRGPQLFLTGEMRHHDVLDRVRRGEHVILSDHTNTERGYLPRLAERLRAEWPIEVLVSARDRDPLEIL